MQNQKDCQSSRKAIAEKESQKGLSVTEEDVLVTNGVSEGLDMTMASIIDPNSEVLMPGPYYPPYASYVNFMEENLLNLNCMKMVNLIWRIYCPKLLPNPVQYV